ncbi:hypothetical protein [Actinoplanes sp. NPDC049118]|uniref:hypothetical protein n=1 Tax=Actinoplanes sp. NPDC049118 TaxID=3155769 RepID=UPI0033C9C688
MRSQHQAERALAIGDRVKVQTSVDDPIEIDVHRHAVILDVEDAPGGPRYVVGHPPAGRRFGPYPAARLTRGW